MDMFFQDIRYGFRILRKNPGFTFVAIFALALGIGANTALFSVVYGVLLRPLPYAEGKQLVVLQQSFARANQPNVRFSVKEIKDYREQARSLQEVEEYHQMGFILLNDKEPDNVDTGVVSAHFFDMLGVKPLLGRNFVDADDRPGAEPVLLLSYKYWKTKHGGDPNVVGRYFRMNDKAHRVIGVLPPIPQYPNENDVYMPTVACPFRSSPRMMEGRDHRMMRVLGRLKPGTTLDASKADMAMLANRWEQAYPEFYPTTAGFAATVDTLHNQLTQEVRPMLLVLLATAGLVLLIACANVANLALARMVRREQELAVRTALGADRLALFRQLLTESTLLSLAGGALGLIFASACVNLLIAFVGRFTTRAAEVKIDVPILLFTLTVSLLTGLIFGCIPALSSRLNLSMALKEGSKASTEKSTRHRVRSLLVIGQVAVSFILLIGAGLMIRSFVKLQRVDAGYNANDVLTVNVPLNFSKYKNDKEVTVFFDRLTAKLEGQAGIKAVAVTSGPPLSPGRPSNTPFDIEGRALAAGEPRPIADVNVASPDSFRLMGVPLISGRFFTPDDKHDSLPVVIVNRSFARHFFPNEDPINKRLSGDTGKTWVTIVGIVGDVKQYGLEKDAIDMVYTPFAQSPMGGGSLLLRAGGDPLSYVKQVREAVYSIDSEQPITDIKTLDQLRGDSLAATRVTAMLLGLFSVLALAIAATGLSGVIAFLVSQRTREIGIRMALGAQTADIQKMVLSDAMQMIGIGLLVGLAGALFTTRVMQKLLFKTGTTDLMTFVSVAIGLALVALVASYLPARSATRVDPLVALRAE